MARPVGHRRNGIREVAQHAGVAIGTVSNVLNNPDLVSVPTRKRVEDAMRALGFVRNGPARQLRAGRSSTVGAVVLDLGNPFFTEVARGVEDRLTEEGCILILCSTDDRAEAESRYLHVLEEQGVRGILLTPGELALDEMMKIRERGTPVVLLDRPSPVAELCSVAVDNVKGGELAAGHLIALGHRRVAFLNGPTKVRQCADRRRGARRAFRAAGLDVSRDLIEITLGTPHTESAEASLEQVLAGPDAPTAIMCVSDLVALGVMRGLRKRRLAVPEDVAVVGYDDVNFAAELYTPLTSVRQPKYQLGRAAADLLLAESSPDHRHTQILYQPELVVRASSRPPT